MFSLAFSFLLSDFEKDVMTSLILKNVLIGLLDVTSFLRVRAFYIFIIQGKWNGQQLIHKCSSFKHFWKHVLLRVRVITCCVLLLLFFFFSFSLSLIFLCMVLDLIFIYVRPS